MAGREWERWEWKEPLQGGLAGAGGSPGEGAACGGCRTPGRAPDPLENLHPAGWGCCGEAAAWPGRRWGCQRLSLPIHHRCRLDHIARQQPGESCPVCPAWGLWGGGPGLFVWLMS